MYWECQGKLNVAYQLQTSTRAKASYDLETNPFARRTSLSQDRVKAASNRKENGGEDGYWYDIANFRYCKSGSSLHQYL